MGKCVSCGEWNTLVEDVELQKAPVGVGASKSAKSPAVGMATALKLSKIDTDEQDSRIVTGIKELDRVLGGGVVLGSLVLLGGEPGAGKSTMLLQLSAMVARTHDVLYVTGEESTRQIKLRSQRLRISEERICVAAESHMEKIIALVEQTKPGLVVIDSIQTMYTSEITNTPGSVSQVKACTSLLLDMAKNNEIPIFIVGHVNKDGAIAGPKVMEHIVDTVLYFEGDRSIAYRILRATKNRYGSTNEIGMFDMTSTGLMPIDNPSEMLLKGRAVGVSGNCVGCILEGTRPILADIQALVTKTNFGTPRRAASGMDLGRTNLLLAVMEKRAEYFFGSLDVYINVVGGLQLNETACDLPLCLSIISSLTDKAVPEDVLAVGEVGLGGEVRSVPYLDARLKEAERIGFSRAIVPANSLRNMELQNFKKLKITAVPDLRRAIAAL